MQRQREWKCAQDIPQDTLREAFLSRFPVRFDAEKLCFQSATPALPLNGLERCVFRIASTSGGDDERLLLSILSSLDKAYKQRYDRQLEEVKSDGL